MHSPFAIAPAVRAEIESRLARVAEEEGVRLLMAIESGSRAWGFPSPDSDYDVRFLYLLRDPVSRLWSQARMLGQRRAADPSDFPAQSVAAMTDMLDGIEGGKADREDYAGAIARLREAVAPEKLLILLQDELMTIPGIARLCRFLGIVDHPADLAHREHEGLPLDLPATLRARAQAALRPQYEYVARLMPELPASWRKNMTEVHGLWTVPSTTR